MIIFISIVVSAVISIQFNVLDTVAFHINNYTKSPTTNKKPNSQKSKIDKSEGNENERNDYERIDYISITAVGDIMLGTNFPSTKYLPPNDGRDILKNVTPYLINSDITFGNLEGVFLTSDANAKTCDDPSVCYNFKMPEHYIEHFKNSGFNLLSIANNHIGDFGEIGMETTVKVLNSADIKHAGLKSCPYTTFEKNGVKFGFTAFSPNSETLHFNDYEMLTEIVTHLDSICDIVIVSFHGGAEGSKHRNITRETENFVGENRGNPYLFARTAIDAGADIILGHGPHVTRAIEIYKDRLIAYSLGNFATYGRFNITGSNGVSPILNLKIDKKGKLLTGEIISTKQIGRGIPVLDKNNRALKEIIELTNSDFPDNNITFENNGKFYPKKK